MKSQYFENIEYGNFYINILPTFPPLLLWIFFIYKFYYPYLKDKTTTVKIPLILILILPFYISLTPLVTHFQTMFGKNIFSPILYRGCFTEAKKSLQEKGIPGIFDFKCGASQVDLLHDLGEHINKRSYYVNYGLLLFILIYGKIKSSKNITASNIIFVSLTLLFGIIGMLAPSFVDYYNISLMFMIMFGTINNLNIAAFLFTLISFVF